MPVVFTFRFCSDVSGNDTIHISDVIRNIIAPFAILTQTIDCGNPLGQSLSLLLIAASFLPLCFKNQCFSVIQSNQEIWKILSDDTIENI